MFGVDNEESIMTQFHVYLDGKATKGIFDTLQAAQEFYIDEAREGKAVEIRTVNSLYPVVSWYYDKSIDQWVESHKAQ